MADQLSLEILIKTIADGKGIQTTDADVKKLAADMTAAAQAGKPLETSADQIAEKLRAVGTSAQTGAQPAKQSIEQMADSFAQANTKGAEFGSTIAKLNNEQLLALEERLRSDIKAAGELGQNTDGLKKKLEEVYSTRTSQLDSSLDGLASRSRSAEPGIANLSKTVGSLKTASAGAQQAMNGLAQGGIGGLVQAGRGAITVFTALGSSAIGAVLIPALAAAGAGVIAFNKIIDANREKLDRWAKESDERAAKLKASFESIEAAAKKSLEAQLSDVDKLIASYGELTNAIDRSRQKVADKNAAERDRKIAEINAREAEALEQAKTPEAQSGVKKKFAEDRRVVTEQAQDIEIENKKLGAEVDAKAAQDALDKANENIRKAAEAAAATAREAKEALDKLSGLKAAGVSPTSQLAKDTLDAAKTAKKKADDAAENEKQVRAKQEPLIQQATQKLEDAQVTKELADLARQKLDAERRAAAASKRVADAKEREAKIAEDQANGLSRAQAEARQRPNQGGVVVGPNGEAKKIDASIPKTAEEKAADEAIKKAQAPKPAAITPISLEIPDTTSQKPATPTPPSAPPDQASQVLQQSQANVDSATQKISSTQPPPALDLSPLAQAHQQLATAMIQAQGKSQAQIDDLAKQVVQLAQQVATIAENIA